MGRLFKTLACVIVVAGTVRSAEACTCGEVPTVAESLKQSSAVFVGKVVARRQGEYQAHQGTRGTLSGTFSGWGYIFTFEVSRSYKGLARPGLQVATGRYRSGDCGYGFQLGKTYLVYAYGDDALATNWCTRTHEIVADDGDLKELGVAYTAFTHEPPLPDARPGGLKTIKVPSPFLHENIEVWPRGTVLAVSVASLLAGVMIGWRYIPRKGSGKPVPEKLRLE